MYDVYSMYGLICLAINVISFIAIYDISHDIRAELRN